MDAPLCPDTVRAALEDKRAGSADEDGIARLAHHALFFAGRGHGPIAALLDAFYPEYANRVVAERRGEVFARVRCLIYEGVLRGAVLPTVLCHDGDAGIVSTAARDIATLDIVEPASGTRGGDLVLKLVITGAVAVPGAALGGLLARGDEAINAKLAALARRSRSMGRPRARRDGDAPRATRCLDRRVLAAVARGARRPAARCGARLRPGGARARVPARDADRAGRAARPAPPCLGAETAAPNFSRSRRSLASIAPRLRILAGLAGESDGRRALAAGSARPGRYARHA
jgi:hypothetical protein